MSAEAGPKVAVVGRPNVGKSTLVNRLAGRRLTIAHPTPGVTRDRVDVSARWDGRSFTLVDTGGIPGRPRGIERSVADQAARAIGEADVIVFVVDAQAGITAEDEALAARLRGASQPVIVVASKIDSEAQEPYAAELYRLGLGDPVAVSGLHGRGSGELLDEIVAVLPEGDATRDTDEARFCLVGRPNVGKSSLFNRLVKDERAVVWEEAGTTRDAIDSVVEVDGRRLRFVDTAGLRPVVKTKGIEYYGLLRSMKAIETSHVALLVVAADEGVTREDKRIAARVGEEGRGLVVALNKWDLVPSEERADLFVELKAELGVFPGTPVLRTSARTARGVERVLPALLRIHGAWTRRIGTADVNRVVEEASAAHPPPRGAGRIKYATQVAAGPPAFVLFGIGDPGAAYRRYVENVLRRAFGFDGVPIRLSFRVRDRRAEASRRERTRGRR